MVEGAVDIDKTIKL